jgi:hypothetical protein
MGKLAGPLVKSVSETSRALVCLICVPQETRVNNGMLEIAWRVTQEIILFCRTSSQSVLPQRAVSLRTIKEGAVGAAGLELLGNAGCIRRGR